MGLRLPLARHRAPLRIRSIATRTSRHLGKFLSTDNTPNFDSHISDFDCFPSFLPLLPAKAHRGNATIPQSAAPTRCCCLPVHHRYWLRSGISTGRTRRTNFTCATAAPAAELVRALIRNPTTYAYAYHFFPVWPRTVVCSPYKSPWRWRRPTQPLRARGRARRNPGHECASRCPEAGGLRMDSGPRSLRTGRVRLRTPPAISECRSARRGWRVVRPVSQAYGRSRRRWSASSPLRSAQKAFVAAGRASRLRAVLG